MRNPRPCDSGKASSGGSRDVSFERLGWDEGTSTPTVQDPDRARRGSQCCLWAGADLARPQDCLSCYAHRESCRVVTFFNRSERLSAALCGLATAGLLAWSVVRDVPHSWSLMRTERAEYAGYTSTQRAQAFGAALPLPMNLFDFYRQYLRPDDRYFIQIQNGAFGRFIDKETAVRSVARLYLLPAVEAPDLQHANVVLSWDSDPGLLHLRYSQQQRLGLQLIFVSRIDRGG